MKRADYGNKQQQQQLSHKVSAELPNSWGIKERCKSNVSRLLVVGSGQFKLAVGLLATTEAPMTVAELCDHSQQQRSQVQLWPQSRRGTAREAQAEAEGETEAGLVRRPTPATQHRSASGCRSTRRAHRPNALGLYPSRSRESLQYTTQRAIAQTEHKRE